VLSEEREHAPPLGSIPGADTPAAADNAPAGASGPGDVPSAPSQSNISPTSFSPFNAPFGTPGVFLPPPGGIGSPPGLPSGPGVPGPPSVVTGTPPGDTPETPPGDTGGPPGDTGPPGGGTPVIPVPEPASWSLMFFGCLIVAGMRRRLQRKVPE
jgi:hypothetical protein